MLRLLPCRCWAAVVIAVTMLAGCGKPKPVPVVEDKAEKVYMIGVSQSGRDEPWRLQREADIKAAAHKHRNLKVIFENAQADSQKQCDHVERFIDQRVSLIIISPAESQALTAPVAKAYEAGIPVIVLDHPLIGDDYTCFISADHRAIGEAAGKWLAEKLGGEGKIVELNDPLDTTAEQRLYEGFHAALNHPGYRIFEIATEWKESKAREAMQSALAQYDEINAVFAHNDTDAQIASQIAKAAGRRQGVIFIGVGGLRDGGIKDVREGILQATVATPTGGAEAIDIAAKIFAGEEVPKEITLGCRVVTADRVGG